MSTFQPPPTWADPVLVEKNPATGKDTSKFNPVWLKWFVDLTANVSSAGAGSGNVLGSASSTANHIVLFADATGRLLRDATGHVALAPAGLRVDGNLLQVTGTGTPTTGTGVELAWDSAIGYVNSVARAAGPSYTLKPLALQAASMTRGIGVSGAVTIVETITTGGIIGVGTANPAVSNKSGITPRLTISGSGVNGATQVVRHTSPGVGGAMLTLSTTRGTDANDYTIVQSGDGLASFSGSGSDGDEYIRAGEIRIAVDGTPGNNDMPGRMVFLVTPDGSATLVERGRIANDGTVTLGGVNTAPVVTFIPVASQDANLTVTAAAGSNNVTLGTNARGMVLQPSAGSGIAFTLSGAGDFGVNTNQLYVDTSVGFVGFGTATPLCQIDSVGTLRSTGSTTPATGLGIEMLFDGTNGQIAVINRTSSVFSPFLLSASTVDFRIGTTPKLSIDSGGNTTAAGTMRAGGYKSSDGSAGETFAATPIATLTVKNGLVVAHT